MNIDKIKVSSCPIPYTPGISHVNKRHKNSDTGTRYVSEKTPSDVESDNPSITINVNVTKITIIVTAKITAKIAK